MRYVSSLIDTETLMSHRQFLRIATVSALAVSDEFLTTLIKASKDNVRVMQYSLKDFLILAKSVSLTFPS